MKMSQKLQLLQHLATEPHITQLQAIAVYRIYNIKGRINELRNEGWDIETSYHVDRTGKRYARYTLHPTQCHAATVYISAITSLKQAA